MLCACSGEQFKFDEPPPQSPESLATRDFSASGLSSRTGTVDWDSKLEDAQVDEVESTLKEALSLNYEEARALLGRLEYQRGNFDAALHVFQGIDIRTLSSRMSKAIAERTRPLKPRSKCDIVPAGVMSLHSVSLLLEAILLKAKSLEELSRIKDAAKECKMILDVVDSALPNGIPEGISEDCKLLEMFHKALELLPKLWIQAGYVDEAVLAYRRALVKPWNLDSQRLACIQKDLAATLLFGGVEVEVPAQFQVSGSTSPKNNLEEAILLLFVLMSKMLNGQIEWDSEIMHHLTFALTISGHSESVADHIEQVLPGIYTRSERWYLLALCYSAAGQNDTALNLVKKISGCSEANQEPHIPSLLLGAKLCSQDLQQAHEGVNFARAALNSAKNQNEHFLVQAHKLLGICYGNAARVSISDFERNFCQREAFAALNSAFATCKEDPEILFSLGLENAIQRNLTPAFNNGMRYSEMVAGSTTRAWKLLALVVSAEQRFKDAEAIVDLAFDETGKIDQMEYLRLKAVLQIAQQQPKQAIETYRILLALIQAQQESMTDDEVTFQRRLEVEAWLDLSRLYTDLESWRDAEICINKAKAIQFYCPRSWHATGALFQAKARDKEALVAFSISLSIEPDYIPSIVSTAQVLMKMGDDTVPIARSFLMNALRLEPTNHDAWFSLGMLAKTEGSLQQAADFFQAAHELKLSAPVQSFV
ncbi:protein NPGR1 [Nicotiana sylvestris]|uniref:Tetratricopeptide repeat protein 7A n=1 Tax=Nicotiana sylvestris TaxID=4096 RepID=A0A1U7VGG5_NICSY|nr:PREDICTED: tetratricopeptide repeat protein 7A [Nicotiana sylvestris]XP_016513331.1 PREDICTED: tetratricopeptide repeat protein 7A-like [Nicotiana tabacum]